MESVDMRDEIPRWVKTFVTNGARQDGWHGFIWNGEQTSQVGGILMLTTEQLSGVVKKPAHWISDSEFPGMRLGDFLLAPVCPINKAALWEGLLQRLIARTGHLIMDPGYKAQYHYPLS